MIEEIIKLRRKGLSFRKIAKEMNSSVGKVQYQWVKYVKGMENDPNHEPVSKVEKALYKYGIKDPRLLKGELVVWQVNNDKVVSFWRISQHTEKLIESYFEKPFDFYLQALRVYDITSIIFNGSNAHQFQEIILPEGQEHWYFKGLKPNRCYCLELGMKLSDTKFFPLMRSNSIQIPRNHEEQVGELATNLQRFRYTSGQSPNWIEHVSTYSYYEKTDRRNTK